MKKISRLLTLILSVAMVLVLFAACADNTTPETDNAGAATDAPTPTAAPTEEPNGDETAIYPLSGDNLELSVWTSFQSPAAGYINNYDEFFAVKAAEEATGVHIAWIEVSPGVQRDQLMISANSGDYPDIYRNFLTNYGTSGAQAYDDGIIINLNDWIASSAPNYLALLEANETSYRDSVDDDGNLWMFYAFITEFRAVAGLTVRQDWLDELNLGAPTSFSQMADVLKAFKTEYDLSSPLLVHEGNYFGGGFLIANGFHTTGLSSMNSSEALHQVNGTVVYGVVEDNFKEYLMMMNEWYDAGLFSSDFISISGNTKGEQQIGMIANGETGIFDASTQLFADFKALSGDDDFSIVGIAAITADGSPTTHFTEKSLRAGRNGYVVTTTCKDVELAVRWIDWWFSDEGMLVANYGVEGESWEYVNGVPSYTDLVMNSEMTDLSLTQAANYYSVYNEVVALFDEWRLRQIYTDAETASMEIWDASTDGSYLLPRGLSLTSAESAAISSTLADINTFAEENIARFITGGKSFDEWDDYVAAIEGMGLSTILETYQAAFNRYSNR